VVPYKEPYSKRTSHGMILGQNPHSFVNLPEDEKKALIEQFGDEKGARRHLVEKYGEMAEHPVVKMSKSLGNVVNPDETIDEYGADTMRLYEMFIGDFEKSAAWSQKAIKGCRRFIERVWSLFDKIQPGDAYSAENEVAMHRTIQKVSEDIENLKMNTAIAQMMTLLNQLYDKGVNRAEYRTLLALLNPFAPHVTEELWQMLGESDLLSLHTWPSFDESKTVESTIEIAVQVNGKVKGKVVLPTDCAKDEALAAAMADAKIQSAIAGKNVVKSIVVPNKIINLVVR
ncbi:MAG TPA: leucine--tRNA ligase, partial [Clostridiales bacterium]|nr:leucine--tRNA ligase [Clostridiales bacterium]